MRLELTAPAKLNLTLEVLGQRPDGYHEIASVVQTIDLADSVRLEPADSIVLEVAGAEVRNVPLEGPRNLAYRAAVALAAEAGDPGLGAHILLEKRVPSGLGLGGGSSDAAAVLRGLNRLWGLNLDGDALRKVAAAVGSDVPLFLLGGTVLMTGRGELTEPLPDAKPRSFTLFLATIDIDDKTRRMYATLTAGDRTDGQLTRMAAASVRRALPLSASDMHNAFDRHIGEVAPQLARAMDDCRRSGLAVFACGSGPGFFTPAALDELPPLLPRLLHEEWGVRCLEARSLARADATSMQELRE